MNKEVEFQFREFKQYARFLLENGHLIQELTDQFLEQIKKSHLQGLQSLYKLPSTQLQALMQNNLQAFLEQSLTDSSFSLAVQKIDKGRGCSSFGGLRKGTEVADILSVYQIKREILLSKLNQFTEEIIAVCAIIQELDQFQTLLEEYVYQDDKERFYKDSAFIESWINNSADGIIAFDNNLKITVFNPVIGEWSKRMPEEIIGLHVFDAFPAYSDQEKYPEEEMLLKKVLRGEKVHIPERPFLHKEGFYEIDVVPLLHKDGTVSGGICVVHETTAKRKTESELEKSKMLLQKVVDTSPTILLVYDLEEKRNVFINRTIKDVLGYEVDHFGELSQDVFLNLFHPEDMEKGVLFLEQIKGLKDGEVLSAEYRMKDSKGKWHWFRSLDTVFRRNAKGEAIQVLGNAQDITAQKEAEETILQKKQELARMLKSLQIAEQELRITNADLEKRVEERTAELIQSQQKIKREEKQLRLIADALPVYIAYIKSDRTFGYVNKAYEHFFGKNKEEILGKPVKEIIGERLYQKQEELIDRCFKGETIKFERKREFDDREIKWFNVSFIPQRKAAEVAGMYVLVEDITEHKNIQFDLEDLFKQLKASNVEKGLALKDLEKKNNELKRINNDLDDFVHVASHDLVSPVNNLQGLLQILKDKWTDKADSEDVEVLKMSSLAIGRLKKTIADLLQVIKVQKETNEVIVEESLVRFKEVAREIKEDIQGLILQNKATITEDFKVEDINYRKSKLRSIIYNLLSNAVKYHSPDRPLLIEIGTFSEREHVVLSVKDNGLGLTISQLKKLFLMFERMHLQVEGTGIGLYSIKRIIEHSGGKIDVKSEAGKGSQFLVYFPKKREVAG